MRRARRLFAHALALVGVVCGVPGVARADEPHRIEWKYPRFRPAEYVSTAVMMAAGFWLERGTRGFPDNQLRGGVFLDEITRDVLVARSRDGRIIAGRVSNVLWHGTQYFPVFDAVFTPLVTDRGNLDAAMQMTLINLQVTAAAFLITRGTHRVVGRTRPVVSGCDEDATWDGVCGEDHPYGLSVSFLSGHASMAFAGAALTCSHHIAHPMYGGNAADAAVCALTLTTATTVGILRIVADKHWWSDVVAGAAVGLAAGFGLPFLLHYGSATLPDGGAIALVPMATETTAGLSVMAIQ